jgi:protein-tyrosine-phosphatase
MPSGAKGSNRNYTVYGKFKSPGASLHWSRKQGNIMPKNQRSKNIEQLLAEADELIQQINSAAIKDLQEEHLLQFEKHAQNLKKIKSEVQGKIEKKGTSEISSSGEGMHEAIQDIVKAMRDLTKYLS